MRRRRPSSPLFALPLFALALAPADARAFQAPAAANPLTTSPPRVSSGGLEAAPGQRPLRHEINASWGKPPASRRAAWERFLRHAGSEWQALWDHDTKAPRRIVGRGIPAPLTTIDAAAAEQHARAQIASFLDLFAPGASPAHFVLVANDLDHGLRTVAFEQRAEVLGLATVPIASARLSFRYRNSRLIVIASEAAPVRQKLPAPAISAAAAEAGAGAWIAGDHASAALLKGAELVALPLVSTQRHELVLAYRARVDAQGPRARYDVYIDARTGLPLAREQLLRFATASVGFDVPVRSQLLGRATYPAPLVGLSLDGQSLFTDALGAFSFTPGGPGLATLSARGQKVAVNNAAGAAVAGDFTVSDGDQIVFSLATEEFGDAQLSAYVHTGLVKARAAAIAPQMAFIDGKLPVNANVSDAQGCNAFWDGSSTNFFRANSYCNNTARVADVVYHEFGHAFHQYAIIPGAGALDPALGEGAGDVMSSLVTGDPKLAPGFFLGNPQAPLREIDTGRRWPDDINFDPHETGLIFAGAMWDLRARLVAGLGPSEGEALAGHLFYQVLRRASDIPSTYAEILAADDDDGDLANGTPHVCAINGAFLAHGLAPVLDEAGLVLAHEPLDIVDPKAGPYPVRVTSKRLYPQCADAAIDKVEMRYQSGVNQKLVTLSAEGDDFVGELPTQPEGAALGYTITVQVGSTESKLPTNPADPAYRVFAGETTPLYCNDFEAQIDGWSFGGLKGYEGDFEWGAPGGLSGDPVAAHSGKKVLGNRLFGTGTYKSNRTAFAKSPIIDLKGEERVRLQFRRWLTVEDAARDQASIFVNDVQVWQNAGTSAQDGHLAHVDGEWRFEDIDLSAFAKDGKVEVRFELASNVGGDLGGWNIDDFCVVAFHPTPDDPAGSGGGGAGGSSPNQGEPPVDEGCACAAAGGGASGFAPLSAMMALLALSRRRRRARRQLPTRP